ncbi:nucleotidyl transferase AbiEii/AbiGii toxin family protein [Pedobacter rhizosphaerae]|nr:nucleotidyl transferase AbiEii/AbiGii toxin family protein [Pedobacter rhizosphaerae]
MKAIELQEFRLVGGTALSLHMGHRMSVDIDLFTDAAYGSIDFIAIENLLKNNFPFVSGDFGCSPTMGKSFLIGSDKDNVLKLDIYYSMDPFFQDVINLEGIRLATVEKIIAMKVDVIQRLGRKKDFWDLHQLLDRYDLATMIELHRKRFEWTHDRSLILQNLTQFTSADNDFDPICLMCKEWIFIKEDLELAKADLNKV